MFKKNLIKIILSLLFFISINTVNASSVSDEKIPLGVSIENIDIGGLTGKDAYEIIEDYIETQKDKQIIVQFENDELKFKLNEIGYTCVDNDYIQQALKIGKTGNLINKYKSIKDVFYNKLNYSLDFTIDETLLKKILLKKSYMINIEPINASIQKNNEKLVYIDHINGQKVNIENTINSIKKSILSDKNKKTHVVKGCIDEIKPIYPVEQVKKCNTIIGTFNTSYKTSSNERSANLSNGANLINNTVIYPGEIFSTYEKLGPFTVENGYSEAGAFSQEKVVDAIGGGACQVTSTLYNAVLMAELDVVERHPHSMKVSYVDLSKDAAIAENYKDFKFKNNTESPIFIESYTENKSLTVNIWGNEIRNTKIRTIKFETIIKEKLSPPPDVITYDDYKSKSYKNTIQSAREGYKTELYKIVYENGLEVERKLINKSIYKPSARHIIIGTGQWF